MQEFKFNEQNPIQKDGKFSLIDMIGNGQRKLTVEEKMILEKGNRFLFERRQEFPLERRNGNVREMAKMVIREGRPYLMIFSTIVRGADYVESEYSKFADQLDKAAANALTFASKYTYSVDDLAERVNDASNFRFWADNYTYGESYAKSWVTKGDEMLNGTGEGGFWPTGRDVSGAPVIMVINGIKPRYREFVQGTKKQKIIYLKSDGVTMGFELGDVTVDTSLGKPVLTPSLVSGGHPQIKYPKSVYGGLELQKDWNDGKGMVACATPTNPSWVDNGTLPAAGVSIIWEYQGIYLLDDTRVGHWSDIISVTVRGF